MESSNYIFLLIFSIQFLIQNTTTVTPKFLWAVVNATLSERKVPKYCIKVIFHNNHTLADAAEVSSNYSGIVGNAFINLKRSLDTRDFEHEWNEAEEIVEKGHRALIEDKLEPCLLIVSFVFHSTQLDSYFENLSVKRNVRHRFSDILQHSTLRNRHLILLRISEEQYNLCPKGARYPTRLVSEWELILFNFFHEGRAIQGPFHEEDEPYLRVTKETGKVKWLCDDIIARLELEKYCKNNSSCSVDEWRPRDDLPSSQPCQLGFKPRQ